MSENKPPDSEAKNVQTRDTKRVEAQHAAGPDGMPLRPTISLEKVLGVEDIPVLVSQDPIDDANSELRILLAAVDGESTVQQIAEVAGMAAEHARAVLAELKVQGIISVLTTLHPEIDGESAADDEKTARPPEYWLAGLQPRTK
jgi:predicted Rossmann fold nucleotide-binding protein DprA/Smf involved in DNA uptake